MFGGVRVEFGDQRVCKRRLECQGALEGRLPCSRRAWELAGSWARGKGVRRALGRVHGVLVGEELVGGMGRS